MEIKRAMRTIPLHAAHFKLTNHAKAEPVTWKGPDNVPEGVRWAILPGPSIIMKFFRTYTAALMITAGVVSAQAVTESKTLGGKTITITYSSPKVNGRVGKLFGKDGRIGQDPTYPVWRAG